jgi:hypothetical protein
MSSPTLLGWLNNFGLISNDRFCSHPVFDRLAAYRTTYLRTKGQHFVLVIDNRGAIYRRESRNGVNAPSNRAGPFTFIFIFDIQSKQICQRGKGRRS